MELSDEGIKFLFESEGLRLNSYKDSGGVWTIGFGTTVINGKPVRKGMTCTKQQAYKYFKDHLSKIVYPTIEEYVNVELNQNQFDSLCSFIYNVGNGAFISSTLLKKLNKNDYIGASEELLRWNKDNGKVVSHLTERRTAEKQLFRTKI